MPKSRGRGKNKFYRHFANGAAPAAPAASSPVATGPAPTQAPAPTEAPAAAPQDDFLMFDGSDTDMESPIGTIPDETVVALQMSTRYYQVSDPDAKEQEQ